MNGRLILTSLILTLFIISGVIAANKPSTQYSNISPLPGGGIALDTKGRPDGRGVAQINIPVAYTPGANQSNVGFYGGSHIGEFSSSLPNGSGTFGAGFGSFPRIYFSAMQVSSLLFDDSKALSAQLQIVEETGNAPALAVGTQDLLDKEHDTGPGKAWYVVATKLFVLGKRNIYLSAGYGSGRFLDHCFGGVSIPISDNLNVAVEYDGFQLNEGITWRPGGRFGKITVLAGYNNRCGFILGANSAGQLPTAIQLAIGAILVALRE
ncbi:MAG: YjbH domain-containing protein [Armatimonadetes bacterium]|nr:YjbH domain-containing protein [Armatimonadota bacterium]